MDKGDHPLKSGPLKSNAAQPGAAQPDTTSAAATEKPARKSLNPELDRVVAEAKLRSGPTDYDPCFCQDVVAVMGEGYSLTAFAGAIAATRATLGDWAKAHPEFAAAMERGRAARTRALETQFLTAGTGAKVAAHVFALKNAAPEDWREHPGAEEAKGPTANIVVLGNGRDEILASNDGGSGDGQS